ncbi:MAG: hypothetical protein HYU66_26875, partial [Armatimonadetes bacterium]|nr:hypothetical protein [Armatimonadota bacterium]
MSVPVDPPAVPPGCRVETLGVTFFDLSRFAEWASSDEDLRIASFLHAFYALAAERLHPASCRIVKFMGDAGLAVFAPD